MAQREGVRLVSKRTTVRFRFGSHLSSVKSYDFWNLSRDFAPHNRQFPEITGEDNLTVFSYSGRVKSPEWRWQRRRADLRHFEIFRHGPVVIYTSLPAGGTCYPICTFPASRECLIGISDAFSAFCLRVPIIFPMCSLYPQQKRAYSALHFFFIVALRPQKQNGLLATGTEWEGDERVKARPRIPPEKDRRDRGPPPEQWKC